MTPHTTTPAARVTLHHPLPVRLSEFGSRRVAPVQLRDDPLTAERFDGETLFFDVFPTGPDTVTCLGPPLRWCAPPIVMAVPEPGLRIRTHPPRIREQKASRTIVSGPGAGGLAAFELDVNGRRRQVRVNESLVSRLAGRRVVVTMSKDNPLTWVRDWVHFHVRIHGADAALIYDNGSTLYGPADLAAAVADVAGLAEVVVVAWPFPYGVGGPPGQRAVDNFCQTGALDHARRALCGGARSVLSIDVDELVPAAPDGVSIFERVERSRQAVVVLNGMWIEAPDVAGAVPPARIRHRDCIFGWRDQLRAAAHGRHAPPAFRKWVCVPSRCSDRLEWSVHDVRPANALAWLTRPRWRRIDADLYYRHFRQINTGWKRDRWRSSLDFAERCEVDHTMVSAMTEAFDDLRDG